MKQGSGGSSQGELIGTIVGALVFLSLVVGAFFWWRRRTRAAEQQASVKEKNTATATVDGVSPPVNPTANEAVVSSYGADIEAGGNPFVEASHPITPHSSRHTIPIGIEKTSPTGTTFTVPVRPQRSPENQLKDDPSTRPDRPVSGHSLEPPKVGYAASQRSRFTVGSVDSTASSATDALYESPTIVTGGARQVIGAVRAEVVQVSSTTPAVAMAPRSFSQMRRAQPGPSPLSGAVPPIAEDPFSDQMGRNSQSSAATDMTFGVVGVASYPRKLSSRARPGSTPLRMAPTSLEDVGHPLSSSVTGSINTNSPPVTAQSISSSKSSIDPYSNLPPPTRRSSRESFASSTSRTDSVLAAFPFVPPSPLPSLNPKSPLSIVIDPNRDSNGSNIMSTSSIPTPVTGAPSRSPLVANVFPTSIISTEEDISRKVPRPHSSTSGLSRASSGLAGFHFHFDDGNDAQGTPELPPLNRHMFNHPNDSESSLSVRKQTAVEGGETESPGPDGDRRNSDEHESEGGGK